MAFGFEVGRCFGWAIDPYYFCRSHCARSEQYIQGAGEKLLPVAQHQRLQQHERAVSELYDDRGPLLLYVQLRESWHSTGRLWLEARQVPE